MSQIEDLLKTFLAYFKFSPKKRLEFVRLVELMETKGLKLLKNVKSCWVYTVEPLIQILQEYRVLLVKMKANNDIKSNAHILIDRYNVFFV